MTNREFFMAIEKNENLSAELREFATASIEKLDKRNANRFSKPSKTALENEPIKAHILEILANHDKMIASEIATELEVSVQKASALCRQLAESKKVVVTDIKVPKKGKQKAYSLVEND